MIPKSQITPILKQTTNEAWMHQDLRANGEVRAANASCRGKLSVYRVL